MNDDNSIKPDCFHCVHFAVSWDPKMPRLCKLYGFKSAQLPSVAVLNSSGTECLGYEMKPKKE